MRCGQIHKMKRGNKLKKALVIMLVGLMVFGGVVAVSALELGGQRDFTIRRDLGKDNTHALEYTEFLVVSINDNFGIGAKTGLGLDFVDVKNLSLEVLPLDLSLLLESWGLNFTLGFEFYPLDKDNDTKTLYLTTSKVW